MTTRKRSETVVAEEECACTPVVKRQCVEKPENTNNACILFFDVETSGFNKFTDSIIQMSLLLVTRENELVRQDTFFVKGAKKMGPFNPNNFSLDVINAEGVEPEEAAKRFEAAAAQACLLVAHNAMFDMSWLETLPGVDGGVYDSKVFCTYLKGKNLYEWKDKRGRRKKPTLVELYTFLFPDATPRLGVHSADVDVDMLRCCFFKAFESDIPRE